MNEEKGGKGRKKLAVFMRVRETTIETWEGKEEEGSSGLRERAGVELVLEAGWDPCYRSTQAQPLTKSGSLSHCGQSLLHSGP